jgi:hypothetical protein
MEKKEGGGLLIFIGLILFIGSYFLYYIFVFLAGIFITYLWIVNILAIMGIINVLVGGIMAKKDLGSWLVLIGVILIFGALFLGVFFVLMSEIFAPFTWIIGILFIMGLSSVVIGGLKENEKGKNSKNIVG